jgi:GNAT superfamily N-acetyltransferase
VSDRDSAGQARGLPIEIRPAGAQDAALLLAMFRELAEYERLSDMLQATEERLHETLFCERPVAEALIAERGAQTAGYAVFFTTYSSFLARAGVWLEDLFVRPPHRRFGVGRALLAAVAARTRERGGARLEWAALDWNELALDFYRGLGARTLNEWVTHRVDGDSLARLADEHRGPSDERRR